MTYQGTDIRAWLVLAPCHVFSMQVFWAKGLSHTPIPGSGSKDDLSFLATSKSWYRGILNTAGSRNPSPHPEEKKHITVSSSHWLMGFCSVHFYMSNESPSHIVIPSFPLRGVPKKYGRFIKKGNHLLTKKRGGSSSCGVPRTPLALGAACRRSPASVQKNPHLVFRKKSKFWLSNDSNDLCRVGFVRMLLPFFLCTNNGFLWSRTRFSEDIQGGVDIEWYVTCSSCKIR